MNMQIALQNDVTGTNFDRKFSTLTTDPEICWMFTVITVYTLQEISRYKTLSIS